MPWSFAMPAIHTASIAKTYAMDGYDGGRAADEPEHFHRSELGLIARRRNEPSDDDVRAVALAVIALTTCGNFE
jgi:hypothetical protein